MSDNAELIDRRRELEVQQKHAREKEKEVQSLFWIVVLGSVLFILLVLPHIEAQAGRALLCSPMALGFLYVLVCLEQAEHKCKEIDQEIQQIRKKLLSSFSQETED